MSDNLMSAFSEMLAVPVPSEAETAQEMDYVTYHLSLLAGEDKTSTSDNSITLRESRWLLASAGATGFRTWEAGLHLGQYLCTAPEVVRGKRVLELGTGTGYVSVLCAKFLGATRAVASDGADGVLSGLANTEILNGLQDSPTFVPKELAWGDELVGAEEEKERGEGVDVVLGSDVTYDTRAIPALIATLGDLFNLYNGVRVILCTAERNIATLETLLELCRGAGMVVRWIDFPTPTHEEQRGPFYDTSVPIHIVEIRRGGA
ncbi:hypothetical protein IMZ48_35010 [Candidatus Bathyarchaeota archaeon]|nr:hypothetical protein [Candidatus Bathyarchaeota archaeon]